MNAPLRLWLEGAGMWAPGLPDLAALAARLRDGQPAPLEHPSRPPARLLGAGERRRAPTGVLLAVEVADQAVHASGRDAATLPSVFASAHGDSPIMDYMCEVLAQAPHELSPTRFHHSVHNAAAGYWTIATGCHRSSNAVCAHTSSFGAGLLEAACQARAEDTAVLLVAFDTPGSGPLAEMVASRTPFGCAMVLAPAATASARACLTLVPGVAVPPSRPREPGLADLAEGNACGPALSMLETLVLGTTATLHFETAPARCLQVQMEPART